MPRKQTLPIVTKRVNELAKPKEFGGGRLATEFGFMPSDFLGEHREDFRDLNLVDNAVAVENLNPNLGKKSCLFLREDALGHILSLGTGPAKLYRPDHTSFPSTDNLANTRVTGGELVNGGESAVEKKQRLLLYNTPLQKEVRKQVRMASDREKADDEIRTIFSWNRMSRHPQGRPKLLPALEIKRPTKKEEKAELFKDIDRFESEKGPLTIPAVGNCFWEEVPRSTTRNDSSSGNNNHNTNLKGSKSMARLGGGKTSQSYMQSHPTVDADDDAYQNFLAGANNTGESF